MLSKDEFVRWVIASHDLFEIFEGRYDAYPLARKWINEWFLNGKFTFKDSEKERIVNLINNLNFDAFGIKDSSLQKKMRTQLLLLVQKICEKRSNVGFAVSFFIYVLGKKIFTPEKFKLFF